MLKKKYCRILICILTAVAAAGIVSGCIFMKPDKPVDFSGDYVSMPKAFADLPEYNEDDPVNHVSIVLPEIKCAEEIYVVTPEFCTGLSGKKGLSENEKLLLTSLQGIVAQDCAQIYIGRKNDKWIKYVSKEYGIDLVTKNDLTELLEIYKDKINGYVRALWKSNNQNNDHINKASTLSGMERLLIVAVPNSASGNKTLGIIDSLGFECKYDLTAMDSSEYSVIMDNLDKLNNDIIILQETNKTTLLRDFGIASKAPFYFYSMDINEEETERILRNMDPLAIAFGWEEVIVNGELLGEVEDMTVERLSKHNMGLVPADYCENLSLWSALPREKFYQGEKNKYAEGDENGKYHYATLLYSDGDNIQCWQGLPFDEERYAYENKEDLPIGWTATPILLETMPMVMKYLYQTATANEEFVCSISGYNFSKLSAFADSAMQAYVKKTARLMKDADMSLIALKDDSDSVKPIWDELSKYDNIDGGFFMYGKYQDQAGNVYWKNGKPLVFERDILWEREDAYQQIEEHPAKVAIKLNYYVKDKTRVEGYSFIQVHSWSYLYSDLYNIFYENLDLEQVKILTPREFISVMKENVKFKDGEMIINTDYIDANGIEFKKDGGYYVKDAYPMWNRLDDCDPSIIYSGEWNFSDSAAGLNGTSHTSSTNGDYAEIYFTGTKFKLFINTSRTGGYFKVYVDGRLRESRLSAFHRNPSGFCEILDISGLSYGEHTVKITVSGKKESLSQGTDVSIDAFYYK